jgi:hypothetical protein
MAFPRFIRSVTGVAALAAALALGGCGGDDAPAADAATTTDAVGATVDSTAVTEAPIATDPPVTDPPVTEPAVTEPPVTAPPADTDGSCLVGEWVVTEAEMNGFYQGLMSTMDGQVDLSVTGSAPLTFRADGSYAWAPDFQLVIDIVGQSGSGSIGGTIDGQWTASEGVVTTASDVNAVEMSVTVGGSTFDGSDMANGLLSSSPINGVTYSCAGPTPVLDFLTAEVGVTIPVTLTAA